MTRRDRPMSRATWGEPEPQTEEQYPLGLLKQLLHKMMRQFGANGAVIALYDESIGQMVIRLHMRLLSPGAAPAFMRNGANAEDVQRAGLRTRTTIDLSDPSSSAVQR